VQCDCCLTEGCNCVFQNSRVLLEASHEILNVERFLLGEQGVLVLDGDDHHVNQRLAAHLSLVHPPHNDNKVIKDKVCVVAERVVADLRGVQVVI